MKVPALAAAVPLLALMSVAQAAPLISGSFSGIATSGVFLTPSGPVDVTGTTVTGTFDITSLAGAVAADPVGPGNYWLSPGAIGLSFDIEAIHQSVDFPVESPYSASPGLLWFVDNGTTQQVQLNPVFSDPVNETFLTLMGPEGSLFTTIDDLASLNVGPGVAIASPLNLAVWQEGAAALHITGQSIVGNSVPEPGSWLMLGFALAAMALARRRLLLKQAAT